MRAIKAIGNNAAICEDESGKQLIALGKGVGFGEMPHKVALEDIKRTFYGVDPKYLSFINEVDPEVLEFSAQLADIITQQVSYELSPNLPVTLADHIQFAIRRAREHMVVRMPLASELEQTHPLEYRFGEMAVNGIQKTFNVRMPRQEAAGIAMSVINAAVAPSERRVLETTREERLIEAITAQVEASMDIKIDRSSFAYSRFITHVRYLLDRLSKGTALASENSDMYDMIVAQCPEATQAAYKVNDLFKEEFDEEGLTLEEIIYLIMHINRVASQGTLE